MKNDLTAFDYDKTVSEAQLAASGWDVGVFKHSNPFECHFIYVCDFRSDRYDLFSVTFSDFQKGGVDAPAGEISPLVAKLVKRYQRGRLNKRDETMFLPALLTYVKGTRSYAQWCQQADKHQRLHFVINIYPSKTAACLRPFILKGANKPVVNADQLMADAKIVHDHDRVRNPDWFTR